MLWPMASHTDGFGPLPVLSETRESQLVGEPEGPVRRHLPGNGQTALLPTPPSGMVVLSPVKTESWHRGLSETEAGVLEMS